MKQFFVFYPGKKYFLIALLITFILQKPEFGVQAANQNSINSLEEIVKALKGKTFYSNYAKGKKLGWDSDEYSFDKLNGEKVARVTSESHIISKFGPVKNETKEKSNIWFSLEGKGLILKAESEHWENDDWKKRILIKQEGKYYLETVTQTGKSSKAVKPPRENLEMRKGFLNWMHGPREKGDKFNSFSIALEEDEIDIPEEAMFVEKKTNAKGEVVFYVDIQTHGAIMQTRLRPDGKLLSGKMGIVFEIRLEEEKTARNMTFDPVDMLEISAVTLNKKLGDPTKVVFLSVEPVPAIDRIIPESTRQKWVDRGGVFRLEIQMEVEKSVPQDTLSEAEKNRYLEATASLQSDDEKIRKLALEITRDKSNAHQKAEALKSWVFKNLKKTLAKNSDSARDVLEAKAGDCTEHTLLFVALARAVGIPARDIGGLAYLFDNEERPKMGWHAWAEIHDGNRWVSVDPTWNQYRVDATHIKFSEGSTDLKWINLLGGLHFKVLEIKREKE